MRVLFLSASAALGGSERVVLEMMAALGRGASRVTTGLLVTEPGPLVGEAARLGAETIVVPAPARFARVGDWGRSPARALAALAAAAPTLPAYRSAFAAAVRAWDPDIVHANALKAHVLAAWTAPPGSRVIWHVHDYVSDRPVSARLLRYYAGRPSAILANSRSVASDVAAVCRRRVEAIHNTVDLERFRPDGPALDLDEASGLSPAPPQTVRVGLLATFARWKGHLVFLDAIAALPPGLPVRGYVIGGPVYRTAGSQLTAGDLRDAIRARGLADRVGLTGFLPDTAPVLRALDVAVHASTRPEPFGLVIAEAAACGRATVVSAAGGAAEIVTPNRDALVFRPGDPGALAGHLAHLIASPSLRHELGKAARAAAERRFCRDRLAGQLTAAYRGALDAVPCAS